jgi:hypothetical protein|tara:strand:- start:5290 stop:5451 length:162 start_codon:yes stop_codon:yes gene_type:complete
MNKIKTLIQNHGLTKVFLANCNAELNMGGMLVAQIHKPVTGRKFFNQVIKGVK